MNEINEFYDMVWELGALGKVYFTCILGLTFCLAFEFANLFI